MCIHIDIHLYVDTHYLYIYACMYIIYYVPMNISIYQYMYIYIGTDGEGTPLIF
jgi:hypothetical protein